MSPTRFCLAVALVFSNSLHASVTGRAADVRDRLVKVFDTCEVALGGPRPVLERRRLERLISLNVVHGSKLRRDFGADGGSVVAIAYEGHRHWRSTMRSVRLRTTATPTDGDEARLARIEDALRARLDVRLFRTPPSGGSALASAGQREYLLGFDERRPITEREALRFFTGLDDILRSLLPRATVRDHLTLRTLEDLEDTF